MFLWDLTGKTYGRSLSEKSVRRRLPVAVPAAVTRTHPISVPSQYSTPSPQLVKIPYRMTGPAIVKILHPIPNTCPSFLYSIAGAATELANPVMGTSAPAPPHFARRG